MATGLTRSGSAATISTLEALGNSHRRHGFLGIARRVGRPVLGVWNDLPGL